jgi:hypothetical protein
VKLYSIVSISRISMSQMNGSTKLVVTDIIPLASCGDVVGEPTCFKLDNKRHLSPSSDANCPVPAKLLFVRCVRTPFCNCIPSMESRNVHNDTSSVDEGVICENCNNRPCNWTKFGPEIIMQLNNNYVGYFKDEDGKVVEELTEKSRVISNCQLCYLAYSAFTSMKHGYLWKKKRTPLPHCVQCGIRVNYPDEGNSCVGFKYADDEDK